MFRRALILGLMAIGVMALVADANACHRCRGRGYSVSGCGYYCHGKGYGGYGGYRVAKVYRTVRVPVQTCTTTCTTVTDPCNPCCTKTVPTQTCTTTYVMQRVLVHTQRVPAGPVYGNYTDGSHRVVWGGGGYGYGASLAPRSSGYGLGGGYRMGGYGAEKSASDFVTVYKAVDTEKEPDAKVVGIAY